MNNQQAQPPASNANAYQQDFGALISNQSGLYPEQEKEILRLIIEAPRQALEDYEHRVLRGEYLSVTTEGRTWARMDKTGKAIINEIGIREILGRLIGIVNPLTIISCYSEEKIAQTLMYFDMSLAEFMGKRSDIWEMDEEAAKMIKDAAVELAQSVLYCAEDGFTAQNIRTQYQKQDINRNEGAQSGGGSRTFLGIPIGKK
jgi:hypothetical protein